MSPSVEIVQYNALRADIEALKAKNAALVFLYDTPEGNKNARSHVFTLRRKKADVERARKEAKADALEYGRRVDAIAGELNGELEVMIDVHQKPLDTIEQVEVAKRAEAERLVAEAKAEVERVEKAKQDALLAAAQAEAAAAQAALAQARQRERDEQIRRDAADRARAKAEAKAKAEQGAAAARERKAIEDAARAEREKAEAMLATERAKLEAERQAIEAEKRTVAAKAKAEQDAKETAERARVAQEQAVAQAKADAERRQRETQAEAERQANDRRQNKAFRGARIAEMATAIDGILAESFSVTPGEWLAEAIFDGRVAGLAVDAMLGQPAPAKTTRAKIAKSIIIGEQKQA